MFPALKLVIEAVLLALHLLRETMNNISSFNISLRGKHSHGTHRYLNS
jgi:hypothetical protein